MTEKFKWNTLTQLQISRLESKNFEHKCEPLFYIGSLPSQKRNLVFTETNSEIKIEKWLIKWV